MTREFIAIGPNAWGRGKDIDSALASMTRNLSSMLHGKDIDYIVYDVEKGTQVTDLGGLRYKSDKPKPVSVRKGVMKVKRIDDAANPNP